jgi:hypothetical protein
VKNQQIRQLFIQFINHGHIRHQTQHAHPQYSIDYSSIGLSQKALGTLPEDGNVMPKHVGATIHN